jgi:hypothetical protein
MSHPIEKLWREAGLPEYFLGNGGTNHKLYELYDRISAAHADRIKKLEAHLVSARDALSQYALSSNWQRNARFDPNNPWFDGISFALIALTASEKKDSAEG